MPPSKALGQRVSDLPQLSVRSAVELALLLQRRGMRITTP